jgi:hypothetical protein
MMVPVSRSAWLARTLRFPRWPTQTGSGEISYGVVETSDVLREDTLAWRPLRMTHRLLPL